MPNIPRFSKRQKRQFIRILFSFFALALAYAYRPTEPEATESSTDYQVRRVIDGDTIEVSRGSTTETVRLIGINTPETVDPRRPVECFGAEASSRAKALLEGQTVTLTPDVSQTNYDRYGRALRYVQLQDGTDIGLTLINEGFAYEYTYDKPYERQAAYQQAETAARESGRGLWRQGVCDGR